MRKNFLYSIYNKKHVAIRGGGEAGTYIWEVEECREEWWAGAKGKGPQPGPVIRRGKQSPWGQGCEQWNGVDQVLREAAWWAAGASAQQRAAENSFALKYKKIYKNQLEICLSGFVFPKNIPHHPPPPPPKKKTKKEGDSITAPLLWNETHRIQPELGEVMGMWKGVGQADELLYWRVMLAGKKEGRGGWLCLGRRQKAPPAWGGTPHASAPGRRAPQHPLVCANQSPFQHTRQLRVLWSMQSRLSWQFATVTPSRPVPQALLKPSAIACSREAWPGSETWCSAPSSPTQLWDARRQPRAVLCTSPWTVRLRAQRWHTLGILDSSNCA